MSATRADAAIEGKNLGRNDMVLKRHKDKPWEWKDNECFLASQGQSECDGVMELKDVNIEGGSLKVFTEDGHEITDYSAPYLEKIWVCNKCGFVFPE